MNREDVTDLIVQAQVKKGRNGADVATKVGLRKERVTDASPGLLHVHSA
mgnify:CR=1 FL=1